MLLVAAAMVWHLSMTYWSDFPRPDPRHAHGHVNNLFYDSKAACERGAKKIIREHPELHFTYDCLIEEDQRTPPSP